MATIGHHQYHALAGWPPGSELLPPGSTSCFRLVLDSVRSRVLHDLQRFLRAARQHVAGTHARIKVKPQLPLQLMQEMRTCSMTTQLSNLTPCARRLATVPACLQTAGNIWSQQPEHTVVTAVTIVQQQQER